MDNKTKLIRAGAHAVVALIASYFTYYVWEESSYAYSPDFPFYALNFFIIGVAASFLTLDMRHRGEAILSEGGLSSLAEVIGGIAAVFGNLFSLGFLLDEIIENAAYRAYDSNYIATLSMWGFIYFFLTLFYTLAKKLEGNASYLSALIPLAAPIASFLVSAILCAVVAGSDESTVRFGIYIFLTVIAQLTSLVAAFIIRHRYKSECPAPVRNYRTQNTYSYTPRRQNGGGRRQSGGTSKLNRSPFGKSGEDFADSLRASLLSRLSSLGKANPDKGRDFSVSFSIASVDVCLSPATVSVRALGKYVYSFTPGVGADEDALDDKHLKKAGFYKIAFAQKIRDASRDLVLNTRGSAKYATEAAPWVFDVDVDMDIDQNIVSVKSMS